MCRKFIFVFSFVFVLSLVGRVPAQDVVIPSSEEAPVLDGIIDDIWFFSTEQTIDNSQVGATPSSPADCSGTWRALWNSEELYVLVDIKDEALSNDDGTGDNKWYDDSIEIYIDGDNSKGTSIDDNDHQYSMRWNDEILEDISAIHHGTETLVGVEYAVATTDDGYLIEFRAPWMSIMGEPATAGQLIGFDVWINDDDDGDGRDSQVSWYSTDGNGWQDPSKWATAVLVEGNKAAHPTPADGAIISETSATLSWLGMSSAVSHNVYFGDNYDDVDNGTADTFLGNVTDTSLTIGLPESSYYPEGLVIGTTYYWRIDEVTEADPENPSKGDIWSFMVPSQKAYGQIPADGSFFIDPNIVLTWTAGFGAVSHTVYFGDNLEDVQAGTGDTNKGEFSDTSYTPGTLEFEKTYYWRIDEFDSVETHTGNVLSFKVAKDGGGVRADYYRDTGLRGIVLTRIDPEINFNWGDPGGPDPVVGDDGFSARWTGEVEAAYTETYTFYPKTDDGVRLWVDGVQLVNSWEAIPLYPVEHSGTIDLVSGNIYSIVMEYFENTANAIAELRWESPSTPKQIVPQAALSPPFKASNPEPRNGTMDTKQSLTLKWKAGDGAASHQVYFGTSEEAVLNATTDSPEYQGTQELGVETFETGLLEWDTTYYWRVDEVNDINPDSPWKGSLWRFTSANFIIVDNFEDYNNYEPDRIFDKWLDGWNIPTNGATAGYPDPDFNAGESFVETENVHGGYQAMPLFFENEMRYSEATLPLETVRDWTANGVESLTVWFMGNPAFVGTFTEDPAGTYTVTGSGVDIWDNTDEFYFAYRQLTGAGAIIARVDSVENTHVWAKAGVMIRNSLDADSRHAMACVTPEQGVSFQRRTVTAGASAETTVDDITAPQWVKIERNIAGNFTASYSDNGSTWTMIETETVNMNATVYIGLAVTSHDVEAICEAAFSNVRFDGTVTGEWASEDIGIITNEAEPLYVAVANDDGDPVVVYHEDTDATLIPEWTEFVIPLQHFADAGIDLTNVGSIAVGIGTRDDAAANSGMGVVYIDDIRLCLGEESE
jgi:hypothetical protein